MRNAARDWNRSLSVLATHFTIILGKIWIMISIFSWNWTFIILHTTYLYLQSPVSDEDKYDVFYKVLNVILLLKIQVTMPTIEHCFAWNVQKCWICIWYFTVKSSETQLKLIIKNENVTYLNVDFLTNVALQFIFNTFKQLMFDIFSVVVIFVWFVFGSCQNSVDGSLFRTCIFKQKYNFSIRCSNINGRINCKTINNYVSIFNTTKRTNVYHFYQRRQTVRKS